MECWFKVVASWLDSQDCQEVAISGGHMSGTGMGTFSATFLHNEFKLYIRRRGKPLFSYIESSTMPSKVHQNFFSSMRYR
jgi:hypothetical protein